MTVIYIDSALGSDKTEEEADKGSANGTQTSVHPIDVGVIKPLLCSKANERDSYTDVEKDAKYLLE